MLLKLYPLPGIVPFLISAFLVHSTSFSQTLFHPKVTCMMNNESDVFVWFDELRVTLIRPSWLTGQSLKNQSVSLQGAWYSEGDY